ncbi:M55 family metallopeptidase [Kitasatospora sp. GP82]|uniref:M55 family metallopeptidase n=1 Tax=Kitasatospora sp. GP82 TaxID=3035089 RepID=UPI0024757383|nr:M55 family metallopeptidase [Kitasatospora sp. GP82]MDH6125824.1 D-amino peptidase [Kitasatospora sp. GP82]
MRVLISADMEGATGTTWPKDVEPGTPAWERMRRLLTSDVNACVEGLFSGGADEVVVNESHETQRNILLDELDHRARLLIGRHKPLGMVQGIQEADAAVFLGYHTGAGAQGVLSHTYLASALTGFRIDGEHADEGRMNALAAAEYGVPVILVTGDDLTCAAAARWAPGARTAAVKECVSRFAAVCLPPSRSAALIREQAELAVSEHAVRGRPEPVTGPHHFEIDFHATHLAEAVAGIPTVEQTGPRTVAFTAPTATRALRTFRICSTVAGASAEDRFG